MRLARSHLCGLRLLLLLQLLLVVALVVVGGTELEQHPGQQARGATWRPGPGSACRCRRWSRRR